MKHLYILGLLLFSCIAHSQIITFADANLKAYLLTASPENQIANTGPSSFAAIDANGDGEIQVSETQNILGLHLDGSFTSLGGVEQFANLSTLYVLNANLGDLTLAQMPSLTELSFDNSNIPTLHLSALSALNTLYLSKNDFGNLDLSDTNILTIQFFRVSFSTLALPQSLTNFLAMDSPLGNFQVHDFPNLAFFSLLLQNNLTALSIQHCPSLNQIDIGGSNIPHVTVNDCAALSLLTANGAHISQLEVTNCPHLSDMSCFENSIQQLSLNLPSLVFLSCDSNQLTTLYLNTPQLSSLNCSNNLLEELDLSRCYYGTGNFEASNNQLRSINMKNGSYDDFFHFQAANNPDLHYICADEIETADAINWTMSNGFDIEVNTYCNFLPGGTSYAVSGTSRFDADANGCQDTDLPAKMKFHVTDENGYASTLFFSSENYIMALPAGDFTVVPESLNPAIFTVSPNALSLHFDGLPQQTTQNFCVSANGVHRDVEIALVPTNVLRPGFDATYRVYFRNNGNTVESGTVTFAYDEAHLDFVSASQTVSASNGLLSLDFSGLQPFEQRSFTVVLNANTPTETPPVNAGDYLNIGAVAVVANDEIPQNNSVMMKQLVVNSLDPNDKICIEGDSVSAETIGQYVHYVIHFENTGTAAAENIVVADAIDPAKFDIATLEPLLGSHIFETRITGNRVEFIFKNINLPFDDANNDGYVSFKIKTKPTLAVGDTFSNFASIYFDYNFPIITDPAITTIQNLGTPDFEFGKYFRLHPNPASDFISLDALGKSNVKSVSIFDANGRLMLQTNSFNVDVSKLSSGLYFAKVHTDKGVSSAKFIKK